MILVDKVSPAAVAEVYEDCRPVVDKAARSFARARRLETAEIQAEANYQFLRAYARHDPARQDIKDYSRYFVRKNLLERARKIARRGAKLGRRVPLTAVPPAGVRFDLRLFMTDLSREARLAVRLALGLDGRPCHARHKLVRELAELGFGSQEIADVFREIREALP